MRLPNSCFNFVHIDCPDLGGHCQVFTVGRIVEACGYLTVFQLVVENVKSVIFLLEVPFVNDAVLAGDSYRVEVRSN